MSSQLNPHVVDNHWSSGHHRPYDPPHQPHNPIGHSIPPIPPFLSPEPRRPDPDNLLVNHIYHTSNPPSTILTVIPHPSKPKSNSVDMIPAIGQPRLPNTKPNITQQSSKSKSIIHHPSKPTSTSVDRIPAASAATTQAVLLGHPMVRKNQNKQIKTKINIKMKPNFL